MAKDDKKPSFRERFAEDFKTSYVDAFKNQNKSGDEASKNPLINKVDTFTAQVTPNLGIYKEGGQSMIIPGTPGQKGFLQGLAETAVGAGISAFAACDERVKEHISPLKTTEINDQLAEFAFFVKDLNECS